MSIYYKMRYMNKKVLLVVGGIIAVVLALGLFLPRVSNALIGLIFLGAIPFTNLSLPPLLCIIIDVALLGWLLYWLFHQPLFIIDPVKKDKAYRNLARKKVAEKTTTKKPVRRGYKTIPSESR